LHVGDAEKAMADFLLSGTGTWRAPGSRKAGPRAAVARPVRLAILLAALALTGCDPLAYNSEVQILSLTGDAPLPYGIDRETFTRQTQFESIEQEVSDIPETHGSTDGLELLRDAINVDATIDELVARDGVPDAIQLSSARMPRYFALFYQSPPRTTAIRETIDDLTGFPNPRHHGELVLDMNKVPRSVRRLAMGVGPLPPPWPVTIGRGGREVFGVPAWPQFLPARVDGRSWSFMARTLTSDMKAGRPDSAARIQVQLDLLTSADQTTGLKWQAVLFRSDVPTGFGTPDGTLFVSDALVAALNDSELVAVLAHLMGHERYQHYPDNLDKAEAIRRATSPSSPVPEVPRYPDALIEPQYAYTRAQEVEANAVALNYLAKIDLPPDALFDALAALQKVQVGEGDWPSFAEIHHLPLNTADLGRMLDAGLKGSR
jgi:hypothetical protein